jgi:hypothetical protein
VGGEVASQILFCCLVDLNVSATSDEILAVSVWNEFKIYCFPSQIASIPYAAVAIDVDQVIVCASFL